MAAWAAKPQPTPPDPAIAYEAHGGGAIKLMVMNADGTNKAVVVRQGRNRMPNWSPDGQKLVFASDLNGPGIYIVNKDGTGLCKLVPINDAMFLFAGPVWSPLPLAGLERIVYADFPDEGFSRDLFAVNAYCQNPGAPVNLTNTPNTTEWFPSWSRFADRLAVQENAAAQGPEVVLYTVEPAGNGIALTGRTRLKDLGLFTDRYAAEPDWAKADDRIALEANLPSGEAGELWITNLTLGGTVNLTATTDVHEIHPSWSPDGREIVFRAQPFVNSNLGRPIGIYKINLATGTRTKLAETGKGVGDLRYPDWRR